MAVSDWLDLMPATITYEQATAFDNYGKATAYATAVEYRARVSYSTRRIFSRITAQDEVSVVTAWVAAALASLSIEDRITLPDGSTPPIISWDVVPDESGNHHTKISFGSAGGG